MTEDRLAHLNAGLSARLVDSSGLIVRSAWWRAADAKELVGNCRQPAGAKVCPGYLVASYPEEHNGIWWYTATCLACDYEVVAPNGKVLPRSSRRSEMPEGGWERRTNAIVGVFGKRDGREAA